MKTAVRAGSLQFDLTGVHDCPAGLIESIARAFAAGCEVELLNPSVELLQSLRGGELDFILIRGSTATGAGTC